MRYFSVVHVVAALLFLHGCAAVPSAKVEDLPGQEPHISKVLQETKPGGRILKRKVAIARFSNETKYGQGFLIDENKDPIGKQAMDILSARLTATNKFLMFERADLDKVLKEMKMDNRDNALVSADYIIVGSVSEFGRKNTSDVGIFNRTLKQTVHAKVNIRLVEVSSGQVVYSEEGAGEATSADSTVMGVGSHGDYDSSLNDKAISAAISKVVNNLIEHLMEKPWRTGLLSRDNDQFVMAGGQSQGVREGDLFVVMQKGNKVKNPQTGFMVELPGKAIAKVQVSALVGQGDPNTEFSMVRVVSGTIPTTKWDEIFVQEENGAR